MSSPRIALTSLLVASKPMDAPVQPSAPIRLDADLGADSSSSSTADASPVEADSIGVAWSWRVVLINLSLFAAAGVCEIAGGWLYWRYFRGTPAERVWWRLLLGMLLLLLYGYLPTLQPAGMEFGRTYAVYGGVFILLSLGWAWAVDGQRPDKGDSIGAAIAIAGVAVMLYWPRG